MKTRHLLVVGCLAMTCPCGVFAQEPASVRKIVLPNLDPQVRARLAALEAKLNPVHSAPLAVALMGQVNASPLSAFGPILADERNRETWEQMPEEYTRLIIEAGEALITWDESRDRSAWSSVQVRRLCQLRLAALPRASLDLYRSRVDAEAKALLDLGRRMRSSAPLRRLVEELFCSSHTAEGLDLLGDLAFERGGFSEAHHWWSMLDRVLASKLAPGRTQAKMLLALMFAGRQDEVREELARFRIQHPQARGALAGRDGSYADTLQQTLQTLQNARIGTNEEAWTTLGGDATRNRPLTRSLPTNLWEDGPAWRVKLPSLSIDGKARDGVPDRTALVRRAAFHPVIVNDQVLVADHRSVVSYHLATGKELFRFDLKTAGLHDPGPGIDGAVRLPRFTLSVDHQRAYVRLGRVGISSKRNGEKAETSYLVCLDLTQPERERKRLLWQVEASSADKSVAVFEGAPIVHEGKVYIALAKIVDERVVTSILCYDTLGRQRWSREVCECPEFEFGAAAARHRQHLVTWAAGQIVYCSHAGAIVAVDAWTGQPTWGVRYASRGPTLPDSIPSPRDWTPCVYADGLVVAAPLDTDRVFGLDVYTGQIRWQVDDIEVTHVLGISHGRVHVATRAGVQAIDVRTGRTDWMQPSEGRLPGLGRGLLAGGWLYWPTTDALLPYRVVALRDGLPEDFFDPTRLRHLPVGNAAFGNGCLAIAGLDELVVFTPPQRQPIPEVPTQARLEKQYHEARRAADPAAAYREILGTLKQQPHAYQWRRLIEGRLLTLAAQPSADSFALTPVSAKSREQLIQQAEQAQKVGHWTEATDGYRRALLQGEDAPTLLGLARAYEGQTDYRSAWDAWTALETRFGDRVEPASGKNYRALKPSSKAEPYVTALFPSRATGPALPLVRAWAAVRQPGEKVYPGDAGDDLCFCSHAGELIARSLTDGALRWKRAINFEPGQVVRWRDLVVAAGDDGAAALAIHDGRLIWSVAAPSRRWKAGSVQAGVPLLASETAGFVHVEQWDDTLLLLDDHRRFARVRLATGEPIWRYSSPAAPWRPLEAASFGRYALRAGDEVLAQDAQGRLTGIGDRLVTVGAPSRPWRQPPLDIAGRIVVPGEQGRVLAYDRRLPHLLAWTYKVPFASSLTGELCRLVGNDGVLIAAVPRNDGTEWVGLDPLRGQRLWSVPARQLPTGLDIDSITLGDGSFYYVQNNRLIARSLSDGALQWQQDLLARSGPFRRWQVRYVKDYIAVHPLDASTREPFFVGLLDPAQGAWLQRLTFPEASAGSVAWTAAHLLVAAGSHVHGYRTFDGQ